MEAFEMTGPSGNKYRIDENGDVFLVEKTKEQMEKKQIYLITAPSGIHLGTCLVACGESKAELPRLREPQILEKFDSREEAIEEHPYWEMEIMSA